MIRHTRLIHLCAGLLGFITLVRPAVAQTVLPTSFGEWTATAPPAVVPITGLDQLLGADAATFREYVVKGIEQRSYAQGPKTASITLYRLRDPSSAYGAFTFLRSDPAPVDVGSFGSASPDRAVFVVGQFLLDVSAKPARPTNAELKQLATTLDKVADHTDYPSIGDHLPEPGRIPGSERYFIGPHGLSQYVPLGTDDWIGFDYSAESMVGRYRIQGVEETLLIATYPTQQVAADKFGKMLRRFVFDPPGGVPPGQTVLFGRRMSSLVAIVVGAPSREAANKLLDQVGYESQVTWNEPTQTLTEPSINVMIVGAFMGTGAIMVLAVAAGVGFGGLRLLVKIFFPNKVFDRDTQIEILQLGISSKPIKAKDFT